MAKNDFQYGRWNSYTLQCATIVTLISPGDCTLQCGMWLWNRDSIRLLLYFMQLNNVKFIIITHIYHLDAL